MCVSVCMYVRRPDIHNQSPWNLAWAPHFTLARHRARGRPQMLTPGGTPIGTPSEKPWRVKNWVGASKQKLLLGVGFPCKISFVGAHPNLGPAGSTLPNGGVCFENWAGASKQKLLLGVGLYIKNSFVGGSPQPKARRVLRSICTGLFHNEIVK